MKKRRIRKLNKKGFSLIELIVAIAILAIVTVPLLQAFVFSARTTGKAQKTGYATLAAQNVYETVRSISFDSLFPTDPNSTSDPKEHMAAEEATLNGFNAASASADVDGDKETISLNSISAGGRNYDAQVILDASGNSNTYYKYDSDEKGVNDKALTAQTQFDNVFQQGGGNVSDPDERAEVCVPETTSEGAIKTETQRRVIELTFDTSVNSDGAIQSVTPVITYCYYIDYSITRKSTETGVTSGGAITPGGGGEEPDSGDTPSAKIQNRTWFAADPADSSTSTDGGNPSDGGEPSDGGSPTDSGDPDAGGDPDTGGIPIHVDDPDEDENSDGENPDAGEPTTKSKVTVTHVIVDGTKVGEADGSARFEYRMDPVKKFDPSKPFRIWIFYKPYKDGKGSNAEFHWLSGPSDSGFNGTVAWSYPAAEDLFLINNVNGLKADICLIPQTSETSAEDAAYSASVRLYEPGTSGVQNMNIWSTMGKGTEASGSTKASMGRFPVLRYTSENNYDMDGIDSSGVIKKVKGDRMCAVTIDIYAEGHLGESDHLLYTLNGVKLR